jgi:hypothetical protein
VNPYDDTDPEMYDYDREAQLEFGFVSEHRETLELNPDLAERRASAENDLRVLLRGRRSRFRALDVACEQQHRVCEVLKGAGGLIYVARVRRTFDEWRVDHERRVEGAGKREHYKPMVYVDRLESPSSWEDGEEYSPGVFDGEPANEWSAVPAECACHVGLYSIQIRALNQLAQSPARRVVINRRGGIVSAVPAR